MRVEIARVPDIPGIRWLLEFERLSVDFLAEATIGTFLVCRDKSGVAGTISLQIFQGAGLLRSLVVDHYMRGRGMGGHLARAAERRARRAGVDRMYLLTTTAEEFFAARGYRIIAPSEAPVWIQNALRSTEADVAAAVWMFKPLT